MTQTTSTAVGQQASTSPQFGRQVARQIAPYIAIARPDHWGKNIFMATGVVLAFFYHPTLFRMGSIVPIAMALVATCLLASSNYVLNEILDARTDRLHPHKRHRPIAAGRVFLPIAWGEWLVLGLVGLFIAGRVNQSFALSSLSLLFMGLIYNARPIRSKDIPFVDVLSESMNNPIRLLLGWFAVTAAEFPPISLLIAYWMVGAFLMSSKRFAEFRSIADRQVASAYRHSFKRYSEESLLASMFFYATTFGVFFGIFIVRYHLELILLVPLMSGSMTQYLRVSFKRDSAAQSPEHLYRERGLMLVAGVCLIAFLALMFVHIPVLYGWFNVQPSGVSPLWKF